MASHARLSPVMPLDSPPLTRLGRPFTRAVERPRVTTVIRQWQLPLVWPRQSEVSVGTISRTISYLQDRLAKHARRCRRRVENNGKTVKALNTVPNNYKYFLS